MAGVLGFEPRKCQIQSLVPYRLAIPQYRNGTILLGNTPFVKQIT